MPPGSDSGNSPSPFPATCLRAPFRFGRAYSRPPDSAKEPSLKTIAEPQTLCICCFPFGIGVERDIEAQTGQIRAEKLCCSTNKSNNFWSGVSVCRLLKRRDDPLASAFPLSPVSPRVFRVNATRTFRLTDGQTVRYAEYLNNRGFFIKMTTILPASGSWCPMRRPFPDHRNRSPTSRGCHDV